MVKRKARGACDAAICMLSQCDTTDFFDIPKEGAVNLLAMCQGHHLPQGNASDELANAVASIKASAADTQGVRVSAGNTENFPVDSINLNVCRYAHSTA